MQTQIHRKSIFLTVLLSMLFLVFSTHYGISQTGSKRIKKLEQDLSKAKGKEKCKILFKLTESYIDTELGQAEKYANQAFREAKKINNENFEADALNQLGTIFYRNKRYKEAVDFYGKELRLREKLKNIFDLAIVSFNLASSYEFEGKDRKAAKSYEASLEYAHQIGNKDLILMNNESLFHLYSSKNRNKKALEYFKTYVRLKDSTFIRKKTRQIAILQTEHEGMEEQLSKTDSTLKVADSTLTIVKKQKDTLQRIGYEKSLEIDNLKLEAELNNEELKREKLEKSYFQIITGVAVLGSILLIFLALLLYKRYRFKREVNRLLEQKNETLYQQKEEIQTQNDHIEQTSEELRQQNGEIAAQRNEIVSGINYALRIQQALLPQEEFMSQMLPQHFILNKPRDIVSGDFFWASETEDKIIFTVADSTGHGVPGAFMSMLGLTLLNEIVMQKNVTDAKQILSEMRNELKALLKQTGKEKEAKDGMDMALCVLDKNDHTLNFAGAFSPMYMIRDKALTAIKATRTPVGVYYREKEFENQSFQMRKGDILYLFSDGFVDQFGRKNPEDRLEKFKSKRFRQLLLEIHKETPEKQSIILNETIEKWRHNSYDQVDDILIMGVFM